MDITLADNYGNIITNITTPSNKSFSLALKDNGNGIFEGEFKSEEAGKFKIAFDNQIKIKQKSTKTVFFSSSKTPDVISLILGMFYSLIDELYQSTVIGRDASALDVLADIIGLILSILFIKLFLNSFVHDR